MKPDKALRDNVKNSLMSIIKFDIMPNTNYQQRKTKSTTPKIGVYISSITYQPPLILRGIILISVG